MTVLPLAVTLLSVVQRGRRGRVEDLVGPSIGGTRTHMVRLGARRVVIVALTVLAAGAAWWVGAAASPSSVGYDLPLSGGSRPDDSLDLGVTIPDTDTTAGLRLWNDGSSPITVTDVVDVSDGFAIDTRSCLGTPIAPGASCATVVTAHPGAGLLAGTLTVVSDGPNSPQTLRLKSWGQEAAWETVNSSYDFGNVAIGTTSESWMYSPDLDMSSRDLWIDVSDISLVGPDADAFSFSLRRPDACVRIPSAYACRLDIVAHPIRGGVAEASLRIRSTASNDPFDVSLRVTGREGVLEAGQTDVDLGTVPLLVEQGPFEVSWTNVGNTAVTISGGPGIWFDNNDGVEFEVPTNTNHCRRATLAPGDSCSMAYHVTVEESGPALGRTSMDSTANQVDEISIHVTGAPTAMRIAEDELDFDDVRVGRSVVSDDVYASSFGSDDLTGVVATLTGSDDFSFDANECVGVTVVRGTGCRMAVRYAPSGEGSDEGTLHVESDTTTPIDIPLRGLGKVATISVGDQGLAFKDVRVGEHKDLSFGIQANVGPITVESVSFDIDTDVFSVVKDSCSVGPFARKGCAITVRAAPYRDEAWADVIRVVTDAGTVTVPLSVTGRPRLVRIEPDAIAFDVALSGSMDEEFTITNVGDTTVSVRRPRITQPNVGYGRFDVVASTCTGIDLAPHGTCRVGVSYRGFDTAGEDDAELTLDVGSGGKVAAGLEGYVGGGFDAIEVPDVGGIVDLEPTRVGTTEVASWKARVTWTRRTRARADTRGVTWEVAARSGSGPWTVVYRGARQGADLAVRPGRAEFRIRARRAGKVSAWRTVSAARAIDDQRSVPKGWSKVRASAALGGSVLRNTRSTASLTKRASMRGIALVVRTGRSAATFDVLVDGRTVATIDQAKGSDKDRTVVWRYAWSRPGTHRVQIRMRSGRIDVDGWLVAR